MTAQDVLQEIFNQSILEGYNKEQHEIICDALEKQIPKKLKINRIDPNTVYMKCLQCKLQTVLYQGMEPDYCPNCGQKIDWSAI